jgi:hypothetical protein
LGRYQLRPIRDGHRSAGLDLIIDGLQAAADKEAE